MSQLDGKVAIISGASSGVGRAAAKLFAQQGASVVVTARREDELNILADEIRSAGGEVHIIAGDVRDETLHQNCVKCAVTEFGGLDIAFNNVGWLGEMASIQDVSKDGFIDTLNVNLISAFWATKYQIPAMLSRGGGSLIYTSSFVGPSLGMPGMAPYAIAKAGLSGLVHVAAVEGGSNKIRANAIASGGIDTPMGRTVANSPEDVAFVEGLHALKRLASPEEIANAALFLASDASSFMTGAIVPVDGGVSKTKV